MSDYFPWSSCSSLLRDPGGAPVNDDQGELETCTRFALAKAICDGFDKRRWVNQALDVDQNVVTGALLQVHKDGEGKWPTAFNGKRFQFQDKISKNILEYHG